MAGYLRMRETVERNGGRLRLRNFSIGEKRGDRYKNRVRDVDDDDGDDEVPLG